jgi:hypothetical protein
MEEEWDIEGVDEEEVVNDFGFLRSASSRAPSASIIAQISSPPKWITQKRGGEGVKVSLKLNKESLLKPFKKSNFSQNLSLSSDDEPSDWEAPTLLKTEREVVDIESDEEGLKGGKERMRGINAVDASPDQGEQAKTKSNNSSNDHIGSCGEGLARGGFEFLPLAPSSPLSPNAFALLAGQRGAKRPSLVSVKARERRIEAKKTRTTALLSSLVRDRPTIQSSHAPVHLAPLEGAVARQMKLDRWLNRTPLFPALPPSPLPIHPQKDVSVKIEVLNIGSKSEEKRMMRKYGENEENWVFPPSIEMLVIDGGTVDGADGLVGKMEGGCMMECESMGIDEWKFVSGFAPFAAVLVNPPWHRLEEGELERMLKAMMKYQVVIEGGFVNIFVENEEIASTVKLCHSMGLEYADNVACVIKSVENEFVEKRQMAGGVCRKSKISMLLFKYSKRESASKDDEKEWSVVMKHQRSPDVVFYVRKPWIEFGDFSRPYQEIYAIIETLVMKSQRKSKLEHGDEGEEESKSRGSQLNAIQYLELWSRPHSMLLLPENDLFSFPQAEESHEKKKTQIFNFGRNQWLMVSMNL